MVLPQGSVLANEAISVSPMYMYEAIYPNMITVTIVYSFILQEG